MTNLPIPFNIPTVVENQVKYFYQLRQNPSRFANGEFLNYCESKLESFYPESKVFMTNSCSSALYIAALSLGLKPGDEVILPSFSFVATANAIALTGAKPIFVDIEPQTMNIDPDKVSHAITDKTKAVLIVHYGGVAANMDKILQITQMHRLFLIEDAAHSILSYFKDQPLGSLGHIGCLSFDHQKNISCGQGGALLVNDQSLLHKVEQIYENGTNKNAYLRGEENQYSWLRTGGNYKMAEISAAFLYPQLQRVKEITVSRKNLWHLYFNGLKSLEEQGNVELSHPPDFAYHNAHIFFIKTQNFRERTALVNDLLHNGIETRPHYIPLHSSPMGCEVSRFAGEDRFTTAGSDRLLRLPLYFGLPQKEVQQVVDMINQFYQGRASG